MMDSNVYTQSYYELLVNNEVVQFKPSDLEAIGNQVSTIDILQDDSDVLCASPLDETNNSETMLYILQSTMDYLPIHERANSTNQQDEDEEMVDIIPEPLDVDIIPPGEQTTPQLFDNLRKELDKQPALDAPVDEWLILQEA